MLLAFANRFTNWGRGRLFSTDTMAPLGKWALVLQQPASRL